MIVLVEDIHPKWELDYGVPMKLTSVCSNCCTFAASVHQRVKDCHKED
jgi:hypothetical protein